MCVCGFVARADIQAAGEVEMGEGERIASDFDCPVHQGQRCGLLTVSSWVSSLCVPVQTLEEFLSLRTMRDTLSKRRNVYTPNIHKLSHDVDYKCDVESARGKRARPVNRSRVSCPCDESQ